MFGMNTLPYIRRPTHQKDDSLLKKALGVHSEHIITTIERKIMKSGVKGLTAKIINQNQTF